MNNISKSMIELVPSLAGGNGLGSGSGKESRVRGDAYTAEIEAVGIEADGEGDFGLGRSAVVNFACADEEGHTGLVEVEMSGMAKFESELRAARAVQRVAEIIFPARVVKKGE